LYTDTTREEAFFGAEAKDVLPEGRSVMDAELEREEERKRDREGGQRREEKEEEKKRRSLVEY